jgi:hypothetical protein
MLYTGGITGMSGGDVASGRPRHDALQPVGGVASGEPDLDVLATMRTEPGPVALPACPLMHGTGALISMSTLTQCGCVVLLTVGGRVPVGYYKDGEKSAATFRVIGAVRFSIHGDYATVEADGTIKLLRRGSMCIDTGGEKVFPEEVGEDLKVQPGVRDAVVVGVPDERWGR